MVERGLEPSVVVKKKRRTTEDASRLPAEVELDDPLAKVSAEGFGPQLASEHDPTLTELTQSAQHPGQPADPRSKKRR